MKYVTAHYVRFKNQNSSIKTYQEFINTDNNEKKFKAYYFDVSGDYAKKIIKPTYADQIDFYWCNKDDGAYKNFFTNELTIGKKVQISQDKLAAVGLMLCPKNHKELGLRLRIPNSWYLINVNFQM